jgi:hypothetical protein
VGIYFIFEEYYRKNVAERLEPVNNILQIQKMHPILRKKEE